jgi:type VII secretion protein EccE
VVRLRLRKRSVVAAELTAAALALLLIVCQVGVGVAIGVGVVLAAVVCLVEVRDLTAWQWALRLGRWLRRRTHRIEIALKAAAPEQLADADGPAPSAPDEQRGGAGEQRRAEARTDGFTDVHVDGDRTGVLIDGHTVVTMVALWGRPYMPTLLKPDSAQTPNTVPLSVIAAEMNCAGLGVDVDIVAEGRRTSSDSYSEAFAAFLRRRAVVGQRTATMVVRLDTHAADTTASSKHCARPTAALRF